MEQTQSVVKAPLSSSKSTRNVRVALEANGRYAVKMGESGCESEGKLESLIAVTRVTICDYSQSVII